MLFNFHIIFCILHCGTNCQIASASQLDKKNMKESCPGLKVLSVE